MNFHKFSFFLPYPLELPEEAPKTHKAFKKDGKSDQEATLRRLCEIYLG